MIENFNDNYLLGFTLGFAGKDEQNMMNFRLNKVKQKEYRRLQEDFEDD